MDKISKSWFLWGVFTLGIIVFFTMNFVVEEQKVFSPGDMTHGHHQIEMSCATCHDAPSNNKPGPVLQNACTSCHAAELKESDDSHPRSKFTDPRNSSRVKQLDARLCMTCHAEHKLEITNPMGVTVPEDFCFKCHQEIADDRPSHKGMDFLSCASSGCHNYHDNRALYEDFLEKHMDEKNIKDVPHFKSVSSAKEISSLAQYPIDKYPLKKLSNTDIDAPESIQYDTSIAHDWSSTSHAQAGINCTACHEVKQKTGELTWVEKPNYESCKSCHTPEVKGFLSGKHGMRLKEGLPAMTPARALLPMKKSAHSNELSCVSCHSSHKFDVKQAAVESCLTCHDDKHSKAYKKSPHYAAWYNEVNATAKVDTGVSCATCHMPRTEKDIDDTSLILSEHNQNMNLRPNDKMLRTVCMNCHGLGFSIDALADKKLIENNFNGQPSVHVESVDLVKDRVLKKKTPKEGSP